MARKKCPKCKRDTWNEKYQSCSACGYVTSVTPVTPDTAKRDTPVTDDTKAAESVTPVTEEEEARFQAGVRGSMPEKWGTLYGSLGSGKVEPGEVCPTCGERRPSEAALKQRAWRSKTRSAQSRAEEAKKNG